MAANRDEILANFQACTGIENFEECLAHLEQNDWNLTGAINSVFGAQGDVPGPAEPSSRVQFQEPTIEPQAQLITDVGDSIHQATISESAAGPSRPLTPPLRLRTINFKINYRGRTIPITVADDTKVGLIKELLSKQLNLPSSTMYLSGWDTRMAVPSDEDVLSSLHLQSEISLTLSTPRIVTDDTDVSNSRPSNGDEPAFSERLTRHFELVITDMDENTVYNLRYEGCKTILDVKQGIYALTNLQPRHQEWTGWPKDCDTLTLAAAGIDFPQHRLSVKRTPLHQLQNNTSQEASKTENDSSDSDEYEDAHEIMDIDDSAMFGLDSSAHRFEPLLPDDSEDVTESLIHFSQEFSARYGNFHPSFYMGPLDDAMKEAFSVPAKERKLLGIYIHHDKSVQSNVFCSQLLCADSIVSFLSQNFVTWAWDITSPKNRERLLQMCTRLFGSVTTATLKNLQQDKFPLFLVVMRIRSNTEVFSVLQGNLSLDELMTSLIHAVDVFSEQRQVEVMQEEERRASEMLKMEQDAAYHASLLADRAKQEEKERQEREEEQRKVRALQEKVMKEEEEKAIRISLEQQLADEPPEGTDKPISTIRMRLPTGETMTRRFLASEKLQMLIVFLGSKGYHSDNHKVLTTWPKRDLTSLDGQRTLQDLGLCPQETLFVEER